MARPSGATQEILDMIQKRGIKCPVELSMRSGKSIKAVKSVAYRYNLEVDLLPFGRGGVKNLEKEVRKKLREERNQETPVVEEAAPKSVEEAKEAVVKDPAYYMVLAMAYKRVEDHVAKLVKEFPDGKAFADRLKTDLKQAGSIAEAKVLFSITDVGDLIE